jgi:arylsulfatase A-like enzyme
MRVFAFIQRPMALLVGMLCCVTVSAADRPNVVFILTDDQRADGMSCAGHDYLRTPNMDRVAAEGARFTNAFVTTSLCSPSRASILSGLYAHAHGVSNNFTDYPAGLDSYPLQLQKNGYATAYIGKWHMGEESDDARPGFDYFVTHKGQGKYFDTEFNFGGDRGREIQQGYYTDRVTDVAVEWLQQQSSEKPFCLILGHKAPHTPFTPAPRHEGVFDHVRVGYPGSAFHLDGKPDWVQQRIDTWHGIYGPIYGFRKEFPNASPFDVGHFSDFVKAYTASLLAVDDSVGRVYETLAQMDVLDDTVLIFTSDNGFFLGEHGMSDKRTMHEASIKVPLLVRFPEKIAAGTVMHHQVLNVDFAPTILELCGVEPMQGIHGRSWAGLLEDPDADWRDAWYYEYNYEKQFPYTPNVRGIRTDEWKYVRYPHGDGSPDKHMAELYHLRSDPEEGNNLIGDPAYAQTVAQLRSRLQELMEATGATAFDMPIDEGIKKTLPDASIR